MTKTYSELISQANTTLPDNTNKDISPADQRNMHTDTLDAHNNGTLIVRVEQGVALPAFGQPGRLFYHTTENILYADSGTAWLKVGGGLLSWGESSVGDLVPNTGGVGVGDATNPAAHVGIGPAGGLVGAIMEASTAPHGLGGVSILGTNDLQNTNQPVLLAGNAVLVAGGTLYIEQSSDVTVDHYAVIGPSTTLPDGRRYSPISLGPVVQYGTTESNSDNTNQPITENVETTVVSLVTANAYAINDTAQFELRLEETTDGNRVAVCDVRLYINAALEFEETLHIQGSTIPFGISVPLSQAVGIGDTLSVRVDWTRHTGGGVSPAVSVRGDISPTIIRISSLT